jgi:hypothetical protein
MKGKIRVITVAITLTSPNKKARTITFRFFFWSHFYIWSFNIAKVIKKKVDINQFLALILIIKTSFSVKMSLFNIK